MPTTPTYGFRYPGPDDDPNAPEDVRFLAEDVEDTLQTLIPDSGVLTNLAVTPGASWSVLANEHRIIGKMMFWHLWLQNDGAQIDASSAGNITGEPVIATVDDASKRPTMDTFGCFRASVTDGAFEVFTDGRVRLASAHSNGRIETAHTLHCYSTYPIP